MKASNFIKLNEDDDAGPQDLLTKGDHSPSKPNWGRSSPKQQISPNIWPSKKGSPELEKYMQDMKKPIHRFKDIDPRFKDIDPRHFKDNDLDYLLFKGMEKIKRESAGEIEEGLQEDHNVFHKDPDAYNIFHPDGKRRKKKPLSPDGQKYADIEAAKKERGEKCDPSWPVCFKPNGDMYVRKGPNDPDRDDYPDFVDTAWGVVHTYGKDEEGKSAEERFPDGPAGPGTYMGGGPKDPNRKEDFYDPTYGIVHRPDGSTYLKGGKKDPEMIKQAEINRLNRLRDEGGDPDVDATARTPKAHTGGDPDVDATARTSRAKQKAHTGGDPDVDATARKRKYGESKELAKLQELAGVSSVTEIVEPHLGQDDGIDGHPLELLEKVAEQFAEDAANGDYTSIDELLKHVPEAKLKGFLSDI